MGLRERREITDFTEHVIKVLIEWESGNATAEQSMQAIQALKRELYYRMNPEKRPANLTR